MTWAMLLLAVAALFVTTALLTMWRAGQHRRRELALAQARAAQAEAKLGEIQSAQTDMQGRLAAMADIFGARHSEMNATLQQRLDAMSSRIGQSLGEQQKAAHDNLSKLHERLAVIDTAQSNIQQLAGQVVELQSILSNKQTRGAFGQTRMEAIIEDGLPLGAFTFQPTLSNGNRPDCIVFMPNGTPGLVIDAKFPLEAWNAYRDAPDDRGAHQAAQRLRQDVAKHVQDIAAKYFLPGETHETAFMFVPSESLFADLHETFEDVVQKASRQRVVIVSPSLLTLSIQVVQAVLRDARLREQAHLIQDEVARLMDDIGRLDDRVAKLATHFGQAQRDIEQIQTSTGKITRRGDRIGNLDVGPDAGQRDDEVEGSEQRLPLAGE